MSKAKFRITVDVTYQLNSMSSLEMRRALEKKLDSAIQMGLLSSGYGDEEVSVYSSVVEEVK